VVEQEYLGDGPQKNVGLRYAGNDWIFSLDADERLTPEAVETIRALDLDHTPYAAFSLRRRSLIGSRWIRVGGWYPDHFVRLYDRRKTRFSERRAHARVETDSVARLACDLVHHSYASVGELFSKGDRFSTRGAKLLYERGRRARWFSPLLHGCVAFLRSYCLRRGFLGGVDGFSVSLAAAVNSYLKHAKLLEFQRDPECRKRLEGRLWD
jgi:glycosyltransferase involved in cell wall biosynthesis